MACLGTAAMNELRATRCSLPLSKSSELLSCLTTCLQLRLLPPLPLSWRAEVAEGAIQVVEATPGVQERTRLALPNGVALRACAGQLRGTRRRTRGRRGRARPQQRTNLIIVAGASHEMTPMSFHHRG